MSIKSPETFQATEAFDDEIDLKELFLVLWNGKLVITLITGFAAVCAVLFALSLPNIYESKALLAPKGESGAGGLAGLARQYGGLRESRWNQYRWGRRRVFEIHDGATKNTILRFFYATFI